MVNPSVLRRPGSGDLHHPRDPGAAAAEIGCLSTICLMRAIASSTACSGVTSSHTTRSANLDLASMRQASGLDAAGAEPLLHGSRVRALGRAEDHERSPDTGDRL